MSRKYALLLSAVYVAYTMCVPVGCGNRPDDLRTAVVTGTVTMDGQPLRQGVVQFVPNELKATEGPPGVGYIDEHGRYEVFTAGQPGAVVGYHRIKVDVGGSRRRLEIPRWYNDEETSGLMAEVRADESNEIQLELSSKRWFEF